MADKFMNVADTPDGPSCAPFAIVPHDINPLAAVPKGIYVGSGGDVTLRGKDSDADVTYYNLPDASYIAVRASHVRFTGTTASNMIAEA
ncbi:spike base protein, RCAP_Rcc01079 family [Sphingobium aromaticiconvertens]|uniref:spike base protein, RCAP_Rcc01079 family n=1 Tax=Sphingobium aromaticiconvertens TaxID=365341 RepID=UPI0030184512